MTPMSSEWSGIRLGDEIEVLDHGVVIARGVIEDLASDQSIIRLKLSYGGGGRTYRREDGWQVRTIRRGIVTPPDDHHFLSTVSGSHGPINVRHTPT